MQHIMISLRTDAYDKWQKIHDGYAEERKGYGITEDHVYRDVRNPKAALVHLVVEDLPRGQEWFQTDQFKKGTTDAKVTGREIYVAEQRV